MLIHLPLPSSEQFLLTVNADREINLRHTLIGDVSFFFFNFKDQTEVRKNSILITRHYPHLGSASDWLNQISHAVRPIRSTTKIWVVTRHQYGIPAFVSQTSFPGETSRNVAKCRLFSQARHTCSIV